MARLFSRHHKSEQVSATSSGSDPAVFTSVGVASVTSADEFLLRPGIELAGEPGLAWDIATAGNAALTFAVPAGKYWRPLSAAVRITADATGANRLAVATTRTSAAATIKALTQTVAVTANQDLVRHFIWGTDDNTVGNNAVAAEGTLTLPTIPVTADTFVLNATTFTILAALTGAENEIFLGANIAATQAALEAAFSLTGRTGVGNLHSVSDATFAAIGMSGSDFAANVMTLTANVKGLAGDALATTESITPADGVFDATTLGATTTGADAAQMVSDIDFPTAGCWLTPAEDIYFEITNGVAGDNFEVFLSYIQYDESIV